MLDRTPLSLRFSIDGEPLEASCTYAEARPHGDFLATTLPSLGLSLLSAYVGSGEFDYVPVVHKTTDAEMGNDVELDEVPAPDPGAPDDPGSVERLLYDHLNRLQIAVRERRGETLSIDVSDEAIEALGDAGRAGAAGLNG